MYGPHKIRKKLLGIVNSMMQNPEPFVKNPGKDFTRKRKISFFDVILTVMSFTCHSTNKELKLFFQTLYKFVPYQSAFHQQRDKINDAAFPYILSEFNRMFPFREKFRGFHIIACDGSDLNVPSDIKDCSSFIPYNSKNGGYYQFHLNVLYDVLEKRYIDLVIQPRGLFNEISAAFEMISKNPVTGKCLYIFDRGYWSFNFIASLIEQKQFFLIRLKELDSSNSPLKQFIRPDKDEFDMDLNFFLTRSSKKIYKEDTQRYKIIKKDVQFDFLDPSDPEAMYHFSGCRLIQIVLNNGTKEYLLTNLPRRKFDLSDMKSLYWMRWGVENSFLFLKYGIALNYLHSIRRDFICQEIYAKLIIYNYISLTLSCISIPEPKRKLKHEYKLSFRDSVAYCMDFLLGLNIWKNTKEEILKHKVAIRPGRKPKRKVVSQRLRSLNHRS